MRGRYWSAAGAALLIGAAAAWVAWYGFGHQPTGDYPQEFASPMSALLGGHPLGMFERLPLEGAGGSVPLTAPAALMAKLAGLGALGSFRLVALYCVLGCALLGLVVSRAPAVRRERRLAMAVVVVGLFVLAPAVLEAIRFGHPEEALGATLCIAAVLLAGGGRPNLAGLALGLAVVNKPWGVMAIPPALLAAGNARVRMAVIAAAIVAGWEGAFAVSAPARFGQVLSWAQSPIVAHPYDVWWPLAHLRPERNVIPTYFPPDLLARHGRMLTVLLAPILTIPLARRRGRTVDDCLALLALLLLLRCLLDPGDHVYYQLPFVLALAAWEARTRGWPVLALWATGSLWAVFHTVSGVASPGVQFAAYLLVVAPVLGALLRATMKGAWPARSGDLRQPAAMVAGVPATLQQRR